MPPPSDTSTLLTIAGMQPLKPYFLGAEKPPHHRLVTVQKVFRTPDIDNVGTTHRHLTFFEMLGNFSIGDYFKQGAVELAWELSLEGFGLEPEKIWITVFEGDEELGLGLDEEAIEAWLSVGVPRERIVLCPRSENLWQAGPTGPCGPCSELYIDRGLDFGKADDLPGGENERFLEYWNLVFMQYNQDPVGTLTPLPAQNIDTGLGPQPPGGVSSRARRRCSRPTSSGRWSTLGEELSGKRYGETFETDRALRILADHTRGMSFLIADGVVPSNEDRGYVLRRVMRRAIVQGRQLGIEPGFLPRFAGRVRELMGGAYPELLEQADTIQMWVAREEEAFNRTLDQGMSCSRTWSRARRRRGRRASAPTRRSCSTTPTASRSTSRSSSPPSRGWAWTSGLRGADGRAARACAQRRPRRAARRARAHPRVRRGRRRQDDLHRLRDHRAGDRGRRDRGGERAACSPSSSSPRSTPQAAARCTTPA